MTETCTCHHFSRLQCTSNLPFPLIHYWSITVIHLPPLRPLRTSSPMPRLLVPRTPTHTSATIPTHTRPRRCSPRRPRLHPRTRNNRRRSRHRRRNRGKNLPINTFTLPHRTSTPTTFKSTSFVSFWSRHAGDVVALESAGLAAGVRMAVLEDREGGLG